MRSHETLRNCVTRIFPCRHSRQGLTYYTITNDGVMRREKGNFHTFTLSTLTVSVSCIKEINSLLSGERERELEKIENG